jgi:hypothetical protein
LEAGVAVAGCGGIDCGHEFGWSATEKSSALRRMALNILQQDTTVKDKICGKRPFAVWDNKSSNAFDQSCPRLNMRLP